MARAAGASSRESRFKRQAAKKSTAEDTNVKNQANPAESSPAGRARLAVRGLRRSYSRSAMRFMVMAAERAPTMATMIHRICRHVGSVPPARAARSAPTSAKGSAKTECSNLIISSTTLMRVFVIRLGLPFPAILLFLRKADLREDAIGKLTDQVVDVFGSIV